MTLSGAYSKDWKGEYDEAERLQLGLVQKGIPIVDADENRKEFMRFTTLRRALQTVIGNASPDNGFKIVGDGSTNDVEITGGDGTFTGAGRLWVEGMYNFLTGDVRYVNTGGTPDERSIYSSITHITGVGNEILNDTAANWPVNSLVGRTVTPDVTQPVVVGTVTANTANTMTLNIDLTASGITAGARYRVNMTTPVALRNDGVYLNCSLHEVDETEVPSIQHNLGSLVTAQLFAQVRSVVEVHQGDTAGLPGALSSYYVDADGFEHFRLKIADVNRPALQAVINVGDVTDLRTTSANFATFLKKIGDNMSGDLNMLAGADITLAPGGTVDGRDVSVDGTKLDTITWTGAGVAALLPKVSANVRPTSSDLTGLTAATSNVSTYLRDKTPGGTATVKGVVTVAPDNRVEILSKDSFDRLFDPLGNRLFGRLTEGHPFPTLSGTWTWTNASFSVVGVGGAANTELVAGDIVLAPDGLYYTVATAPSANSFTTVEPFAGVTAPIAAPAARRWTLTLRKNVAGTESNYVPATDAVGGSVSIAWWVRQVFDQSDHPALDDESSIPVDAESQSASTTRRGTVVLAPSLGVTADTVVTADDIRVGRVKGRVGVTLSAFKQEVELASGAGISVGISESGDKVIFTITNSMPGGGVTSFPGFGVSPPAADSGSGSAGGSGLASDSGHIHPLSASYKIQTRFSFETFAGSPITLGPTFQPRLVIAMGATSPGSNLVLGMAKGTAAGDQASASSFGTSNQSDTGFFLSSTDDAHRWTVTAFASGSVTVTRTVGTDSWTGGVLIVGDLIP
jgi:hypothetical protein